MSTLTDLHYIPPALPELELPRPSAGWLSPLLVALDGFLFEGELAVLPPLALVVHPLASQRALSALHLQLQGYRVLHAADRDQARALQARHRIGLTLDLSPEAGPRA